jgi:hypothetical protein
MRAFTLVFAAIVTALATASACVGSSPPPSGSRMSGMAMAGAAGTTGSGTVIAADLPALPPGIDRAARSPDKVKAAFEFAARHPEVLTYIPCFCGCERMGHKGNEDCFVARRDASGRVTAWEPHGMICETCIDVANTAMQLHDSGASLITIRATIERRFGGAGMDHTPTPLPPSGS